MCALFDLYIVGYDVRNIHIAVRLGYVRALGFLYYRFSRKKPDE
jgi:hypothetical protein